MAGSTRTLSHTPTQNSQRPAESLIRSYTHTSEEKSNSKFQTLLSKSSIFRFLKKSPKKSETPKISSPIISEDNNYLTYQPRIDILQKRINERTINDVFTVILPNYINHKNGTAFLNTVKLNIIKAYRKESEFLDLTFITRENFEQFHPEINNLIDSLDPPIEHRKFMPEVNRSSSVLNQRPLEKRRSTDEQSDTASPPSSAPAVPPKSKERSVRGSSPSTPPSSLRHDSLISELGSVLTTRQQQSSTTLPTPPSSPSPTQRGAFSRATPPASTSTIDALRESPVFRKQMEKNITNGSEEKNTIKSPPNRPAPPIPTKPEKLKTNKTITRNGENYL